MMRSQDAVRKRLDDARERWTLMGRTSSTPRRVVNREVEVLEWVLKIESRTVITV